MRHDSLEAPVRLGLVLSGGGLRGAAHLGVLRHLLRDTIPLDVVVGVSAGAIVAGYYATGDSDGVALPDIVRASASIPGLFPAIQVTSGGRQRALIDGGISDPVPLAFARRLGAT